MQNWGERAPGAHDRVALRRGASDESASWEWAGMGRGAGSEMLRPLQLGRVPPSHRQPRYFCVHIKNFRR